jgi:hypothetical protein
VLTASAVVPWNSPFGYLCVFNGGSSKIYVLTEGDTTFRLVASGNAGANSMNGITIGGDNTGSGIQMGLSGQTFIRRGDPSAGVLQQYATWLHGLFQMMNPIYRVMTFGDSHWEGDGSGSGATANKVASRRRLTENFYSAARSRSVAFEGSSTAAITLWPWPRHDGVGGEAADEVRDRALAALTAGYRPDVILWNIGTNNLVQLDYLQTPAEARDAIIDALTAVWTADKAAHSGVATIQHVLSTNPDIDPGNGKSDEADALQALIPGAVTTMQGLGIPVTMADVAGTVPWTAPRYADDYHFLGGDPGDTVGASEVADVWLAPMIAAVDAA